MATDFLTLYRVIFILIEISSYFCQIAFWSKSVCKSPKDCLEFGKLSNDRIKQNSEPTFVKGIL